MKELTIDYKYESSSPSHTNGYLWKPVLKVLGETQEKRIFDLGCGNGSLSRHLQMHGYQVQGVDPSEEGILQAKMADPSTRLEVGNAYEPLASRFGKYPVVVSLEVVEHVYYPRKYAACIHDLLLPNGLAIISTPYHSYIKNLVLSLTGKMESHFTVLWDHGHIKFWSVKSLTRLFAEKGMICERVLRVGRLPFLAKSVILIFRRK